jgi:DNA polymerase III delta subunit
MIYVITGPDAFLVRAAVRKIRDDHDPENLNTSTIDARPSNVEEIVAAVSTHGFFGSTRIVVVNDLVTTSSKTSDRSDEDEDESKGKAAVDWNRLVQSVRPENILILVDRDLRSVPAAVKRLLPPDSVIVAGDPPRGNELIAWIKSRAKSAGSTISDANARGLAELISPGTWTAKPANPAFDRPPDLDRLAGEIEKLALYAHPDEIEGSHIRLMIAAGQADRLFPLIDAVIAMDGTLAMRELGTALCVGDEASRITAQLNQQAELMAALSTAERTEPADVGRALGLSNPNRMIAINKSLRRSRGQASRLLAAARQTELQLKSGVLRQPVDGTYALVERILSIGNEKQEGGN